VRRLMGQVRGEGEEVVREVQGSVEPRASRVHDTGWRRTASSSALGSWRPLASLAPAAARAIRSALDDRHAEPDDHCPALFRSQRPVGRTPGNALAWGYLPRPRRIAHLGRLRCLSASEACGIVWRPG
jgi:hypothetical protein